MNAVIEYVKDNIVPTDPAELERLMNDWGKEPAEQDETAIADNAPSGVAGKVDGAVIDKEPDGIFSKDGKHIIPYDALKSERQARQEYQNKVVDLERQLEAAKSGVVNLTTGDFSTAYSRMSDEDKAEMEEYLPDRLADIKADHDKAVSAQSKIQQFESDAVSRQKSESQQVAISVQEAIDNNPTLSHWSRNNPEAWAHCIALDELAKASPINANLTMEQRFEKVVKQALIDYENPFPDKKIEANDLNSQPKAKPPIHSLSAFKGGEAAESSLFERMADMSPAEISAAMVKMSPKEQDAFLSKLANNE